MAQTLYEESNIQAIANAIRSKLGISSKMRTSEMASKINAISSGGSSGGMVRKTGTFTVSANCESFTVDTGLSAVHTVIVRAASQGTVDNTLFWSHDDAASVDFTGYRTQYVTYHTNTAKLSINGGSFTCEQYSSNYPIVAKNFDWVAYGNN